MTRRRQQLAGRQARLAHRVCDWLPAASQPRGLLLPRNGRQPWLTSTLPASGLPDMQRLKEAAEAQVGGRGPRCAGCSGQTVWHVRRQSAAVNPLKCLSAQALSRSSGAGLPCATCRCASRGLTGTALVPMCFCLQDALEQSKAKLVATVQASARGGYRGCGPVQSECTCLAQTPRVPQACNHSASSLLRLTPPACDCALQEARRHEQAATAAQAALAEGAPCGATQCGLVLFRLPLLPMGCRWSSL